MPKRIVGGCGRRVFSIRERWWSLANEKNLKKGKATQFKSGEEAARIGKKGGEASGKAKREKKTIQNILNAFLDDNIKGNVQLEEIAKRFGIEISSSKKELFTIVSVLNTLKDCDLNDLEKMMKLLGEDKDASGDGVLATLFDDFKEVR